MRILKIYLLSFLILFGSSLSFADRGWVSSGGEVFRTARNPWFLDKNVSRVNYCVLLDETNFSATGVDVRAGIHDAIDYWKSELAQPTSQQTGFASVGGQVFNEQDQCSTDTDLTFKFGYGTLSPDEIKYFNETSPVVGVKAYIGVSVRQTYDTVLMKGSGFVYIASDKGPNAYVNPGQMVSEPWKSPKLLSYALMHELGHVFGFPHTGTGLMSEVFLDQLLHPRFASFYQFQPLQPILQAPRIFEIGPLNGNFDPNYFQIPPDTGLLRFEAEPGYTASWRVYTKANTAAKPVEVGLLRGVISSMKENSAHPAVVIHLPPDQQVFSATERFINTFMIGPLYADLSMEGFFRTVASPKPNPIFMEIRPDGIVVLAVVSGKVAPVMTYAPPTLTSLMIPAGP